MDAIAETKAMKSKALRELIRGLDTQDKSIKLKLIKTLGDTVTFGVKVDAEQEAINALQEEANTGKWRVRKAANQALEKIRTTKRISSNPLELFQGGVGFTSKK